MDCNDLQALISREPEPEQNAGINSTNDLNRSVKGNNITVDNSNSDIDDDVDGDDDSEEMHSENYEECTKCLFCSEDFANVNLAIVHLKNQHNINLITLKEKFSMDQYSFIKLINCIRNDNISPDKLANAQDIFWEDEKYLKCKGYEPWLDYDYDQLPVHTKECSEKLNQQQLVDNLKHLTNLLQQADKDRTKMVETMARIIDSKKTNDIEQYTVKTDNFSDSAYFSTYAHFSIHREMLSDTVRTTSYRDALLKNTDLIKGKTVLDVGCGTAVLSIFAAQAGASKVVGIDNSEIVYNAMSIVGANNYDNITLIRGRLEETTLPIEKYDIIISEWMGYFLLFEGMLDSIIYARQHHLKEGGVILPNRCTLNILGYGSVQLFEEQISFWDNVYGINMSVMRKEVLREPLIEALDAEHMLTNPEIIFDINMSTVSLNYSIFTHQFNLKCIKAGKLTSFVGYFDTYFDLKHSVMFSTSPTATSTHWRQVVFFIDEPRDVQKDEIISGKIICKKLSGNERSLDIKIEVFGKKFSYYLN